MVAPYNFFICHNFLGLPKFSRMELLQVTNKQLERDFLKVNVLINKHDPNYIQPLDKDILQVFDPEKNKAFRFGEASRWVLRSNNGELIGRIAAFTNKKYKNKGDSMPVGGIGFFDCINDQHAADSLFDVAKHWLMQRGMEAMDGPINFGERDRWWGLLVEGFTPPVYCLNYNQPYYIELFENYGFKNFFNQYCFTLKVRDRLQEKFYERHAALYANKDYRAEHLKRNKLEKYARDFATVYNKAWAGHGGLKQIDHKIVLQMFKSMLPIMDEKIIWFTYYKNEPIALWANIPDVNFWNKFLHGRFDLWGKIMFMWYKLTKKCTKITGIVFGIVPEFQGKGVDSYMIVEGAKIIQNQLSYTDYEMQWIGEFNPKMINVAESLGTKRTRRLVTYRYLFDQTIAFQRHPVI